MKTPLQILKISQISKIFDEHLVLDSVDLTVSENEIFGFIGLNGMGKTTLIKIALDLLRQDSGEVEIFGINKILPNSRRKICYLPEKFQPSTLLKGREFLQFALDFYGKKPDEQRLKELCENLDFDFKMLKEKVTKYSKGMVQKLGLMATFLSEAELLILDEPMSGLDSKARINLKQELLKYKKRGNSIFFSSHILVDMEEICDKIAVLNKGKIVFEGAPQAFKHKHQDDSLEGAFLKEITAR